MKLILKHIWHNLVFALKGIGEFPAYKLVLLQQIVRG